MPFVNILGVGRVQYPDEMSPEEIRQHILKDFPSQQQKPDRGIAGLFASGVKRDLNETYSLLGDVLPGLVGKAVGADDYAKGQFEDYAKTIQDSETNNPRQYASYEDINSPGSALGYAAERTGELVPTLASLLLPGAIAGKIAKPALEIAARDIAATAGKKAAEAYVRKQLLLRTTAATLPVAAATEIPAAGAAIQQATGEINPWAAVGLGAVNSALDVIFPARILSKLSDPARRILVSKLGQRLGMVGTEALEQAGLGAGIGGTKELVNLEAEKFLTDNAGTFGSEDFKRVLEGTAGGGLTGGLFGAGFGAIKPGVSGGARLIDDAAAANAAADLREKAFRNKVASDTAMRDLQNGTRLLGDSSQDQLRLPAPEGHGYGDGFDFATDYKKTPLDADLGPRQEESAADFRARLADMENVDLAGPFAVSPDPSGWRVRGANGKFAGPAYRSPSQARRYAEVLNGKATEDAARRTNQRMQDAERLGTLQAGRDVTMPDVQLGRTELGGDIDKINKVRNMADMEIKDSYTQQEIADSYQGHIDNLNKQIYSKQTPAVRKEVLTQARNGIIGDLNTLSPKIGELVRRATPVSPPSPEAIRQMALGSGRSLEDLAKIAKEKVGSDNIDQLNTTQLMELNNHLKSLERQEPLPFTDDQYRSAVDALQQLGRVSMPAAAKAAGIKIGADIVALRNTMVARGDIVEHQPNRYRLSDVTGMTRKNIPIAPDKNSKVEYSVSEQPVTGTDLESKTGITHAVIQSVLDNAGNVKQRAVVSTHATPEEAQSALAALTPKPELQRPMRPVMEEPTATRERPMPLRQEPAPGIMIPGQGGSPPQGTPPTEGLRETISKPLSSGPDHRAIEQDLRQKLNQYGLNGKIALRMVNRIREEPRAEGAYGDRFIRLATELAGMEDAAAMRHLAAVMDHEVIHALRDNGLFTTNEWTRLSRAIKETPYFKEAQANYKGRGLSEDALAEEAVAMAFREYNNNPDLYRDKLSKPLLRKIADIFRAMMGFLRGRGLDRPEKIYDAINAGKVGSRNMQAPRGGIAYASLPDDARGRRRLERMTREQLAAEANKLGMGEAKIYREKGGPLPRRDLVDNILNRLKQIAATTEEGAKFALAWHGTPHEFGPEHGAPLGKFRDDKMGTGEGAQAFGWGHYFAANKTVGQSYREDLSGHKTKYYLNGKRLFTGGTGARLTLQPSHISDALTNLEINSGDVKAALKDAENDLTRSRNNLEIAQSAFRYNSEGVKTWEDRLASKDHVWRRIHAVDQVKEDIKYLKGRAAKAKEEIDLYTKDAAQRQKEIDWLKENGDKLERKQGGSLYEVNIAPDDDKFLNLDKPLDQQSKHVQEVLGKLQEENPHLKLNGKESGDLPPWLSGDMPGLDMYKEITGKVTGNEQKTSKLLASRGIRGNIFLDHVSRKHGTGTSNYVVFDPADVRIDNKYSLPPSAPMTPDEAAAHERIFGRRDERSTPERVWDTAKNMFGSDLGTKLRMKYVDKNAVFERDEKRLHGSNQTADVSPWAAQIMADRGRAVWEELMLEGGRMEVYRHDPSNPMSYIARRAIDPSLPSLAKIVGPLVTRGLEKQFQLYAAAKRGMRLSGEGKETPLTPSDIRLGLDQANQHPEIVQAYSQYQQLNRNLMNFAVDAGVISREQADNFLRWNDYYPFYRQLEEETSKGPRRITGVGNDIKIHQLKGGTEKLGADMLEVLMRNSRFWVESGMQNIAAKKLSSMGEQLGVLRRLPNPHAALEAGEHALYTRVDGERQKFATSDPMWGEALTALSNADMPKMLQTMAIPAQWLRELVTRDPGFALIANPIRDTVSAWLTTGVPFTPVVDTLRGMSNAYRKTDSVQRLRAYGVIGGFEYAGKKMDDAADLLRNKVAREGSVFQVRDPKTYTKILHRVWDGLGNMAEVSDTATRDAIFRKVLAQTGNEVEAAFRALESINFAKHGTSQTLRAMTMLTPFLNARIQGLDVLMQGARKNPMKFLMRGTILTAASLAIQQASMDDPEIQQADSYLRDANLLIPLRMLGIADKGLLAIPKPFEVGLLFQTIPENLVRMWNGSESSRELANMFIKQFASTFGFQPMPQASAPMAEATFNLDLFTGRPIVGPGMEKLPPEMQYDDRTSELAKRLGQIPLWYSDDSGRMVGVSPKKIDHVLQGYGGTLGTYLLYAADVLFGDFNGIAKPARTLTDVAPLRRFIKTQDNMGNKQVNDLYDMANLMDGLHQAFGQILQSGDAEAAKEFVDKNRQLLALRPAVSEIQSNLQKLRQQELLIRRNKNIDPEEKRTQLQKLRQAQFQMTRRVPDLQEKAGL